MRPTANDVAPIVEIDDRPPVIESGPPALSIAVLGAGYWGPYLVRNILGHEATDLRWVCDLNRERASRVAGRNPSIGITTDVADVLDDPSVDAVAVATPPGTHYELALRAIEAGKHVLVEKPLAVSMSEAESLVKAADHAGVVLMCDHTYCYTEQVRKIRSLVRNGDLGSIQFVDSVRINLGIVQRDADVFWDLAPHDVSILDFVLPEELRPLAVSAIGSDPIGAGRACVGYMSLQLADGLLAHVHVNWLSPVKMRTMIIGGSRRNLVWDDLDVRQPVALFDRGVEVEPLDPEEERSIRVSYRTGDMVAPALRQVEALHTAVGEFASAITEGRAPLTDGRSGLRVLAVLEAAQISLANGGAFIEIDGRS
jgi:predicted dehydrogenase